MCVSQDYVKDAVHQYAVPAVSIAVWKDQTLSTAAAGLLNIRTGVEASRDAIFQIGSITKVFTTCLVMQLVDEGKVDLDKPVKHYLRDFCLADAHASGTITVRQLLNHTSGIDGDFFVDDQDHTGNLIARYVDRCSLLPLMHPVGKQFCYSNAAFAIAGRLVEVVRGMSWYQAMRDYIYSPLGMTHAIADPKEMIRYRTAMGHVLNPQLDKAEGWRLPEQAYFCLGQAPAGTTPAMSAADLISFARAHLEGGLTQTGERWLSQASIEAMQTPSVTWPLHSKIKRGHTGLGWLLADYNSGNKGNNDKPRVISHTGGTMGFLSVLHLIPEQDTAFAVLINGFDVAALDKISRDLFARLTHINLQEPEPPSRFDPLLYQHCVGHYESSDAAVQVFIADQQLQARFTYKLDPLPPENLILRPVEEACFATYLASGDRGANITFVGDNRQSCPQYIYKNKRLIPRQQDLPRARPGNKE